MVGPNGSFYDDPDEADEFESRADLFVLVPNDVSIGEYTGDNPGLTKYQEDLLEQEVVSRIPFSLKVYCPDWAGEPLMVIGVDYSENDDADSGDPTENCYVTLESGPDVHISMIRPYLRPLSEMTDSEWAELDEKIIQAGGIGYNHQYNDATAIVYIDFMLKHHFDYRGLIDMGLAIKAPKEMYG